jgi:hypothetical protein
MLNAFITSQKQNVMKNFKLATVWRGYYIWKVFTPKRENASHPGIMMAAVSSKCEESLHLDKSWIVRAKVLKTCICMA